MQNPLRSAAQALAQLAEKAHQWADWTDDRPGIDAGQDALEFAGVDIVGIDFSTSIQQVSHHVIQGWNRYRSQVYALRPNYGFWTFGVNAVPFRLTRRPVPPWSLPKLSPDHFGQRGDGRGLIQNGSAFYDYFFVALEKARALGVFDEGRACVPITISLFCDGCPNGGVYRASDIWPLLGPARAQGVRFKVVGVARFEHRYWMHEFGASLGLTGEELEISAYTGSAPDLPSISSGFESLSSF